MRIHKAVLSAALLIATTPAFGADTVIFINGNVGPWSQALNPTLDYGAHDNMAPGVIDTIFDFSVNSPFSITYLGSKTSPNGGTPYATGIGDTAAIANGGNGSGGNPYPSKYIDSSQYPAYVNAAIGAFTDGNGVVVGTPFLIGEGISVLAPAGAAALQFGVNDDVYSNNSGLLLFAVVGNAAPVPEPAAWALMVGGFGMAGMALRRRQRLTVRYA
jgi:hypothetical protein